MTFEIKPVTPEAMTWEVKADGKVIRPQLLTVSSPYGVFTLGWRPENYHGWAFKPGKGGAMTLPWSKAPSGDILVGLVHENRPNFGSKKVWCPLSGFIEIGESAKQAAARESMEEGGINVSHAVEVPGARINNDRMYYIMEEDDDWGMKVFSFEIPFPLLEQVYYGMWRPQAGLISHKKESDLFFMRWQDAVRISEDGLALAGIARLTASLL